MSNNRGTYLNTHLYYMYFALVSKPPPGYNAEEPYSNIVNRTIKLEAFD